MRLLATTVWLTAASPWAWSLLRPEIAALRTGAGAMVAYLRESS